MQIVFLFLLSGLSTAKRKFADSLNDFKFQCIGDAETDDEICIGEVFNMKFTTLSGLAKPIIIIIIII